MKMTSALYSLTLPLLAFATNSYALNKSELSNLDEHTVQSIKQTDSLWGNGEHLRMQTISDRGFKVGAQYGYIDRIKKIQEQLQHRSKELDKIYNFSYLMSMSSDSSAEMYLVPPIVAQQNDVKVLDAKNNTLTMMGKVQSIITPARLVTTPLDWRQYLIFSAEPEKTKIPESVMPVNDAEKAVWKKAVDKGWSEGEQVAEREMLSRFESLYRDAAGILWFNRLVEENKMEKPKLVMTRTAVAGDKNQLIENKVTYRIVTDSSMNLDTEKWKPLVLDNRQSMIFPDRYDIDVEVQ